MATKKKPTSRIVHLGSVSVDSGQLMMCDPGYIATQFKQGGGEDVSTHPIYKHIKTGKLYQFCYRNLGMNTKSGVADVIPFPGSYADVIPALEHSPNELIERGIFVDSKLDPNPNIKKGEFSYNGICKVTKDENKQGGQLNFILGHKGAAVAFRSGLGDGSYEVFAEIVDAGNWGERIKKVWVELLTDAELKEILKHNKK